MANYKRDHASPKDIAVRRSMLIDDRIDRELFRERFTTYRNTLARLRSAPMAPLEIETLGFIARAAGPVQEAAMIEALASLRAEGVRL